MDRIYFQIPFSDKDKAKELGARWDASHRLWFTDDQVAANVLATAWKTLTDIGPITELPGEDREFGGNNLYVDLIPSSCWFTSVRYCIEPADWQRLSNGIRERADHKCEICGEGENKEAGLFLEAHERWEFIPETFNQVLRRIICLCSLCHRTTHYGYAQVVGQEEMVKAHFIAINGVSREELDSHIQEAFEIWGERNEQTWALDLSIIIDAGIRLKSKPKPPSRVESHEEGLTIEAVDVEDFISRMT